MAEVQPLPALDAEKNGTTFKSDTKPLPQNLPEEPYILSTPSEKPYSLAGHHRDSWRIEGLFSFSEERLQYQTFLWRDSATTLYALMAPHEEKTLHRDRNLKANNSLKNGAVTPLHSAAKKKISLSDYKKAKTSGQLGAPTTRGISEVPNVKAPVVQRSSEAPADKVAPLERVRESESSKPVSTSKDDRMTAKQDATKDVASNVVEPAKILPDPIERVLAPSRHAEMTIITSKTPARSISAGIKESTAQNREDEGARAMEADKVTSIEQRKTKRARAEDAGADQQRTKPHLPEAHVDRNAPSTTPIQANGAVARATKDLPGWLPGASPWENRERIPTRIPDIPSWLGEPSSRSGDEVARSPRSSPDTLKLSATYSQTSHSSVTSSAADITRIPADPVKPRPAVRKAAVMSKGQGDVPTSTSAKFTDVGSTETKGYPDLARKTLPAKPEKDSAANVDSKDAKKGPHSASGAAAISKMKLVVQLKYGRGQGKIIQRILQLKPSPRREPVVLKQQLGLAREQAQAKRRRQQSIDHTLEPPNKRKKPDDSHERHSPKTPIMPPARSPIAATPSSSLHRQVLTPRKDLTSTRPSALLIHDAMNTPRSTQNTPHAPEAHGGSLQLASDRTSSASDGKPWKAESDKQVSVGKLLRQKMKDTFAAKEKAKAQTDATGEPVDTTGLARKEAVEGVESVLAFMLAFVALGQGNNSTRILIAAWESLIPWAREVSRACVPFPHLHGLALLLDCACCAVVTNLYGRLGAAADPATVVLDAEGQKKMLLNQHNLHQRAVDSEERLSRSVLAAEYPLTNAESQVMPFGMLIKPMVVVRMGLSFLEEWTSGKMEWKSTLEEGLCAQL